MSIPFKNILHWSWQGINAVSVLLSFGVPTMLRAIFHKLFEGWVWYDQLLLFIGTACVILAILIILFHKKNEGNEIKQNDEMAKSKSNELGLADSKRLVNVFAWVEPKMQDELNNPLNYIHSRLIKVSSSESSAEMKVIVEWFNTSMFDLRFKSVNGEVWMGKINEDLQSLGHSITFSDKPKLTMCGTCICTCHLQVIDANIMNQFFDSIKENIPLQWKLNLNWELATVGIEYRKFTVQQAPIEIITLLSK